MNFPNKAYRKPSMEREIKNFAYIRFRRPLIYLFGRKYLCRETILKKFPFLNGENDDQLLKKYYSDNCDTIKKTIDFWNHEKIVHQEIYDSIMNLKPIDKNKFL